MQTVILTLCILLNSRQTRDKTMGTLDHGPSLPSVNNVYTLQMLYSSGWSLQ
jgi:hypothetical protein